VVSLTLRKLVVVNGATPTWVVERAGRPIGLLAKIPNGPHHRHPWRAWAGVGDAAAFLGAFWTGRAAALAAVERRARWER
jgi:hypothetical protein